MTCIYREPRNSVLLVDLWAARETLLRKLREAHCWSGYRLTDPELGHSYERLECGEHLLAGDSGRVYVVGVHRFAAGGATTEMHNHRYRFAAWPFNLHGRLGDTVYDMPWQRHKAGQVKESGSIAVEWGQAYAIEDPLNVYHAVHSHGPHLSLVISDATQPPARKNRLQAQYVGDTAMHEIREQAWIGLQRAVSELLYFGPVPASAR